WAIPVSVTRKMRGVIPGVTVTAAGCAVPPNSTAAAVNDAGLVGASPKVTVNVGSVPKNEDARGAIVTVGPTVSNEPERCAEPGASNVPERPAARLGCPARSLAAAAAMDTPNGPSAPRATENVNVLPSPAARNRVNPPLVTTTSEAVNPVTGSEKTTVTGTSG